MSIIINSITTSLSEDKSVAIAKAIAVLNISADAVTSSCIIKSSLDARKRTDTHFVHSVALSLDGGEDKVVERAANKQVTLRVDQPLEVTYGTTPMQNRPVIVGFGPAGMFAGLLLARHGYRPIILERGSEIDRRVAAVEGFWANGTLDTDTNVQFGEGGAGTFSDGKLTTRIGDEKCTWVLDEFVKFGAPEEILQKAKPHIGTDRLREIVKNIRQEIISLDGEIHFNHALTDLKIEQDALSAAVTAQGELATDALILATGHSARDTFTMLHERGLTIEAKPFSVGVRIEHLQSEIDRGLYGELAGHPSLPVGEYQLSHRLGARGVYTFCMCPGGFVVPSSSQEGMVVTNGMSCYARDGANANSAIAVSVTPDDFGKAPLAGMLFQQKLERFAYNTAGKSYKAPAQDVGSFLHGKAGLNLGKVKPSYNLGVQPCDFKEILPNYIIDMLKLGLMSFERKIHGFSAADAILTGVETRTSSPIRVLRGDDFQSVNVRGIYPCAEGAGYAGGIMSAAVDGIRVALAIMAKYKA